MRPFSLEEYLANPSRKVVTREGRNVRIICTDRLDAAYPICALINYDGVELYDTYTIDGQHLFNKVSDSDLFFVSEKKEGWINIWSCDDGTRCVGAEVFDSYKDAKNRNIIDRIATIKIEWEE